MPSWRGGPCRVAGRQGGGAKRYGLCEPVLRHDGGKGKKHNQPREGEEMQQSCGCYRLSFAQAKQLFLGPDWP